MNVDQLLLVIWPILRILTVVKASENIALGKPSDQSSDYGNGWDSSKAVDGCLNVSILSNCCTHTRLGQAEAWWQVDLQTHSAIDTVDIIYREGEDSYVDRLAGYAIYLSDTTDWTSGTRCHKDDTPDLASMSATQNVQCPGVARYLTIYNDRRVKSKEWYSDNAYMELCEVQVYGCPVGRYGNGNCNNDCLNCLGSLCNTTSGVCAGGCKTGFTGLDCRCPVNCRDTTCGNGECTECEDGYFGPFCTACSNGCNDRFCEKVSGNCSVCIAGYHGSSCNQTCPENCNGNSCIKHSGFCTGTYHIFQTLCCICYRGSLNSRYHNFHFRTSQLDILKLERQDVWRYARPIMRSSRNLWKIWSAVAFLTVVDTSVNTSLDPKVKTSQSSLYKSDSSDKAVDGCTTQIRERGCCSHTAGSPTPNEAWWQINLGDQIVIEYIQIYYREGSSYQTSRFAGYRTYLTNTTEWRNSDSCHIDTTSVQTEVNLTPRITTCTGNTRYLTFYVDRRTKTYDWYSKNAILELCEVQIFGCPVGRYGNGNCDSSCDISCVNSLCHPGSGHCTYCAAGFFKSGRTCTVCPQNCLNDVCNEDSGVCADCEDNFFGPRCVACSGNCADSFCDKRAGSCSPCINGFHGSRCNQSCPENCQNKTCDQNTGECTACANGYHGDLCNQRCPATCRVNACQKDSGECKDCKDGFFGPYCVACAPNCAEPVCDRTFGHCSQCKAGYHGRTCDQACASNCKNNICIQDNSFCTECNAGYHGDQCEMNCSSNCKDSICNKTNGRCLGCETGYHGNDCSLSCPDNCRYHICMQENGHCFDCDPGFHGSKCLNRCGYCQDGRCNKDTGYCVTSCIEGLSGHRCDIKVVSLPSKEEDINAAAIGIGCVGGVCIVVMAIVIVVQARRLRLMIHQNTMRYTTMTDILLPNAGQDQRTSAEGTYEVLEAQKTEENTTNVSTEGSRYEQL